jgi:PST family polysaccharide transporter
MTAGMDQAWLRLLPRLIRTRIEGRDNLQNILGNTGWLFGDKIVRMGVGLLVGAWVARYLGPAQFGLYNYAIAFVALFAPLATLGLDGIVVHTILRDPSHQEETLGTVFLLRLCSGISVFFAIIGAILLIRSSDSLLHWLVGIIAAGLVFQAFDTIDLWFQSRVQSRHTVCAKNGAFLIISVVKVTMILSHAPLIAFAWAGLGEVIVGALGLMLFYRRNGLQVTTWRGSLARARILLRDGWPMIFAGISIIIYMKIDVVMLGNMVGDNAVGVYSAASRISEIWYFIPTAIVTSVFPSIVQSRYISESMYYDKLQRLFSVLMLLALVIAILMTFLSTPMTLLLFGQQYAPAGPILAVHIWAALFVFLGVAQSSWDIAENLTRLALFRTVMGAVINVVLNMMLIPRYAAMGAAVATVVSYAFSAYLLNVIHPKTRRIFMLQTRSILFVRYLRMPR